MEQEYREHTVAVYSSELERLSLCQVYQSQYQRQEEQQNTCRTQESFLLSYRTEDEVSILLWHELELSLGSIQESLTLQTSRTDGNLALMNIISGTRQVFDVSTFTVGGQSLSSYQADVDTDPAYTPDTEVIENGAFQESKFRSAPYFDLRIDGITLLDEAYG